MSSVLSQGWGGLEDKTSLLCSLLLGFGLDAYVIIGKTVESEWHQWVMVRDAACVYFYETLNGDILLYTDALNPKSLNSVQ